MLLLPYRSHLRFSNYSFFIARQTLSPMVPLEKKISIIEMQTETELQELSDG